MAMPTFSVLTGAGAHTSLLRRAEAVWFTAQSTGKQTRLYPTPGLLATPLPAW
jgi:hypothetical protein